MGTDARRYSPAAGWVTRPRPLQQKAWGQSPAGSGLRTQAFSQFSQQISLPSLCGDSGWSPCYPQGFGLRCWGIAEKPNERSLRKAGCLKIRGTSRAPPDLSKAAVPFLQGTKHRKRLQSGNTYGRAPVTSAKRRLLSRCFLRPGCDDIICVPNTCYFLMRDAKGITFSFTKSVIGNL